MLSYCVEHFHFVMHFLLWKSSAEWWSLFILQWKRASFVFFYGSNLSDLQFSMAIWCLVGSSNNMTQSLGPKWAIFNFSPGGCFKDVLSTSPSSPGKTGKIS